MTPPVPASSHGSHCTAKSGLWLALVLSATVRLLGENEGRAPITDAAWLWAMPTAQKSLTYSVRLEGRIEFYDPYWKLCWIDHGGESTFLRLAAALPNLHTGAQVLIEGTVVPALGLDPALVKVAILREAAPVEPLRANGRINNTDLLNGRIVTAEAFVDGQQIMNAEHVRLTMLVDNRPVVGWVKPEHPESPFNYAGRFVRVTALYSSRFDPTGTQNLIEFWVRRPADIAVLEKIEEAHVFDLPVTPIDQIRHAPINTQARIQGVVKRHDPGNTLTIRDATGEIVVRSLQLQRLMPGTPVEAVGRVATSGSRLMLLGALYRRMAANAVLPESGDTLTTIEQIRQLTPDDAAHGRRVRLAGVVAWSLPEAEYFFLEDLTGGVRVQFSHNQMPSPALSKYLRVEGATQAGRFAPVIRLDRSDDLGSMDPPDPTPITYDEAVTGQQDGQWVQIRGFMEGVVSEGDWRMIHVTTPLGAFVAHIQTPVLFVANPGALIRLRGVCETTADENGRITGIMLRVPYLHDITVEEDASSDPFDLPVRSIRQLIDLSSSPSLLRVRTAGTVIHAVPGQYAYVQEKDATILMLGRATTTLAPGDRIEAVGVLGREGARAILRETTFRRTGQGTAPTPVALPDPARPEPALDSRLVSVRGTVIDVFHQPGNTRLTLQNDKTIYEATLAGASGREGFRVGQVLGLTGIYRLVFDDARQWRGFQLQLRSAQDAEILAQARFWTIERALVVSGVLGGIVLLGVAWISALRRRVNHQTAQIRKQLERQARLEVEVQRAARLESLSTLAGGIAHDFNNLLTVVLGNVTLLMSDLRVMERGGEYLREIERGARRARELTQHLLTFAKGGDPLRGPEALPEIARQSTGLVLHGTNVRAEYDFAPDIWAAHIDKDQMAQAIQNLVLNAVQAMPRGGTVRVTGCNEELAEHAKPGLAAGRYVKLALADAGEGIAPENLSRIFDPYFTTRSDRTGLGLSTVYSIVRRHQGRIEVESVRGTGTTFTLWLPASDEPVVAAPAPVEVRKLPEVPMAEVARPTASDREAVPVRPKPRVLLMDDEESIRRVVEIVLQRLGCEAVVVADGEAALREFEAGLASGRPIDLLILDLTIPGGMGGRQVMEAVRQRDPNVPAIVSSGYSNDPVLARFADYGFQAMVQKPYDVRQFAAVISEFVGAGRPSATTV